MEAWLAESLNLRDIYLQKGHETRTSRVLRPVSIFRLSWVDLYSLCKDLECLERMESGMPNKLDLTFPNATMHGFLYDEKGT